MRHQVYPTSVVCRLLSVVCYLSSVICHLLSDY
jgi:hypothetical protein